MAVAPVPMMPTRLPASVDRLLRPARGVIGLALEALAAGDVRQRVGRQRPQRGDEKGRADLLAAFEGDRPVVGRLVEMRGGDAAVEPDVPAQVELVGHVVQVAQRVRLGGKMLRPVPLLQQLLRKGVAIGPALRIEAGARVAVPVPGAADIRPGFEHLHAHAELAQPVELVEAGNAGADDDHLGIHGLVHCPRSIMGCAEACSSEGRVCRGRATLTCRWSLPAAGPASGRSLARACRTW